MIEENQFITAEAPRTFGSMWVSDAENIPPKWVIPVHELIDEEWVETPEYKELMKNG